MENYEPVQHAASDTMARSRVGVMYCKCESVVSIFSTLDISGDNVSADEVSVVGVLGPSCSSCGLVFSARGD